MQTTINQAGSWEEINTHLLALTVKGFPQILIHFHIVLMKSHLHKEVGTSRLSKTFSRCCKAFKFATAYEILISTIICGRHTVVGEFKNVHIFAKLRVRCGDPSNYLLDHVTVVILKIFPSAIIDLFSANPHTPLKLTSMRRA